MAKSDQAGPDGLTDAERTKRDALVKQLGPHADAIAALGDLSHRAARRRRTSR